MISNNMNIQQTSRPNFDQNQQQTINLQSNGIIIQNKQLLHKAIFKQLFNDQKTNIKDFQINDINIFCELGIGINYNQFLRSSTTKDYDKSNFPENNAIFQIFDKELTKSELKENKVKNFIEIEGKFYSYLDVTETCKVIKILYARQQY